MRQDVTWDPLSMRLNRGREVCNHKMSLMSHSESAFLLMSLNCLCPTVSSCLCLCWDPLGHIKHAPFQPPLFSTGTISLVFIQNCCFGSKTSRSFSCLYLPLRVTTEWWGHISKTDFAWLIEVHTLLLFLQKALTKINIIPRICNMLMSCSVTLWHKRASNKEILPLTTR